jgi:hypothetical protein
MWGNFWGIVFLLSLLVFAAVSAVVTVAGFRDVWTMFRRLREGNSQTNPPRDE